MARTSRQAIALAIVAVITSASSLRPLAAFGDDSNQPTLPVKVRATQQTTLPNQTASGAGTRIGTLSTEIDALTKQVLRDEIDLQKFNLLYRINAAPQGRWKGWRYFASQETNLALTESGTIVSIGERGEHIHGKKFVHESVNKIGNGGALQSAIAQIIAGSGSGIEFAINKFHSHQSAVSGYSPNQARDAALKLIAQIDERLAARDSLIGQQSDEDKETIEVEHREGKVLADFRDLSEAEFERYHQSEKRTLAQQNSFYLLDLAKNSVGAVGSFYLIFAATHHARALNLPGGILTTIAGSMIASNAIVSRLIGRYAEGQDQKDLANHRLPAVQATDVQLNDDYQHLRTYCSNHQYLQRPDLQALEARLEAYDCNLTYEMNDLQRSLSEHRQGIRTAYQNIVDSILVGGTKIQVGTLTTIAGARYPKDGMHTNSLLFTGAVGYLPGISVALLENVRIQLESEHRLKERQRKHQSTSEIVSTRITQLNDIKSKL